MRSQPRLTIAFSIFSILILIDVIGQDNPNPELIGGKYYFLTAPVFDTKDKRMKLVTEDSVTGNSKEEAADAQIKMGHKIRIIDSNSERIFFKYLKFTGNNEENLQAIYNGTDEEPIVFSLSHDAFENYTRTYYNKFRGFKVGTFSVPVRLRSSKGNFEFDANVSIGASLFARWSLNRRSENLYFDLSFGISLTKVNLNGQNSILGSENTDFADIDVLSPSAMTYSFGLTFNLAKNVNIGTYYGWDFLSSADQKAGWIYNKKPWVGVGFNVVIADKADASSSDKGTNEGNDGQ